MVDREQNTWIPSVQWGSKVCEIAPTGEVWSLVRKRLLVPTQKSNYHIVVALPWPDGTLVQNTHLRDLLAQTFVPNPNPLEYGHVHMVDGDYSNLALTNLQWQPKQQKMSRYQKQDAAQQRYRAALRLQQQQDPTYRSVEMYKAEMDEENRLRGVHGLPSIGEDLEAGVTKRYLPWVSRYSQFLTNSADGYD